MRNFQSRLANEAIAVKQDVEVQGARTVENTGGAVSAEFLLDAHKAVEKGMRIQFRLQGDGGIDEPRLGGETNRFCRIE